MYSRASAPLSKPAPRCHAWHVGVFVNQSPQHRLMAQHTANACAEHALAWLVWPGQACYNAGLPLGGWGKYIMVTDLSPLHTCVHGENVWHLHSRALAGSDELSQYRISADWHLLSDKYFLLHLVAFHLESVFWYACCQIPLNTPLGIRNVFINRTGCLAASELFILFLYSCWASLLFQVSETMERCCRKTCKVPCDGLSL